MLISSDKSLIGPLTTTLGLEDLYDLIEVAQVDAHNDAILRRIRKRREENQ